MIGVVIPIVLIDVNPVFVVATKNASSTSTLINKTSRISLSGLTLNEPNAVTMEFEFC